MAFYLCPLSAILQYFNDAGVVLKGGQVFTYLAGTSTPTTTYTDSTGGTANANPIVLDSAGRLPNVMVWQPAGVSLKVVVKDSLGNQLGPTFDNISGINDPADVLSVLADAASGSGSDLVANAVRSYDIVSSVQASGVPSLSAGQTLIIEIEGQTVPNDGMGGSFYWDASSSAADDGGITTIKPTAESGNGRYIRRSDNGSGTFTATLATGFSSAPTGIVGYDVSNGVVTLFLPNGVEIHGTSNGNAMTLTGLPAAITPGSLVSKATPCTLIDNGTDGRAAAATVIGSSAKIVFSAMNVSTGYYAANGFTSSGDKGLGSGWTITYSRS